MANGFDDQVKVLFKLNEDASEEDRASVLKLLDEQGVDRVRPLFPGEEDGELASMFVAEFSGDRGGRLLNALNSLKAIQYAEKEPIRKLIG